MNFNKKACEGYGGNNLLHARCSRGASRAYFTCIGRNNMIFCHEAVGGMNR